MNDERLKEWMDGTLDDDLSDAEVKWLDNAVMAAIARKALARPGVITMPPAPGLH